MARVPTSLQEGSSDAGRTGLGDPQSLPLPGPPLDGQKETEVPRGWRTPQISTN